MRHATVIIGAGLSGLCSAIALLKAGHRDFVILEKASDVGGVWRDNVYPGCGCDVLAHKYCYSFDHKRDWDFRYGRQPEILSYIHGVVRRYALSNYLIFNTTVISAKYSRETSNWLITTNEASYVADAIVVAVGPLHRPSIPDLPGLSAFCGTVFHSARWDSTCDLSNKRVAVVGTGASAVQFIPEIAKDVTKLYVFQRTPPWVLRRRDRRYGRALKALLVQFPWFAWLYRAILYWRAEVFSVAFSHATFLMWPVELKARLNIRRYLTNGELRRRLTPEYKLGCKRVLRSDNYYPTFRRPNVELITSPIATVSADGLVTRDGLHCEVDAIIFGTGFHVIETYDEIEFLGISGQSLKDAWRHGMEAYLGICVSGFPNMFLMIGPNTGVGHTSVIFVVEAQARWIAQLVSERRKPINVSAAAQKQFNAIVQKRLAHTVWAKGGCSSWYLDRTGINRTLWPGSTLTYWWYTRRPRLRDFLETDA